MSYRREMANGKYYILVGEDQDRIKIGTILRKILNNYSIPCVLYIISHLFLIKSQCII